MAGFLTILLANKLIIIKTTAVLAIASFQITVLTFAWNKNFYTNTTNSSDPTTTTTTTTTITIPTTTKTTTTSTTSTTTTTT